MSPTERLIGMIDLTDLNDDSTSRDVAELCDTAQRYGVAGVCVWPDFVAVAADRLRVADDERSDVEAADEHSIDVVTVVNFPTGTERPFAVGQITANALENGASEIDVVLPYHKFMNGDIGWCADMLDTVREVIGDLGSMKVILETGELVDYEMIRDAARFAIAHGADFVKSSTGKSPVSATIGAFEAMVDVVAEADRVVGLKPSGGIRTRADAERYVRVAEDRLGAGWATPATFRFGASGLLSDLTSDY